MKKKLKNKFNYLLLNIYIIMSNNAKKEKKSFRICILGDNKVGKSFFINCYLTSVNQKHIKLFNDKNKIEISKEINNKIYNIKITEFSKTEDKNIKEKLDESNCVFIIFNMAERDSFDNLVNKWLIFLRENIHYDRLIILLGNYYNLNSYNKFLITDEDELKKLSEIIEVNFIFYEIGNKTKDEKIELIENLIKEAEEYEKKEGILDKRKNDKNCMIF
jgi:GTPase SAR1 family protein